MAETEYPPVYQYPGDTTVVGDVNGAHASIICVEHPAVLDFIEAFRTHKQLTEMPMQVSSSTLEHAARQIEKAFKALPAHIWRELERREADIILPGGG